MATAALKRSVWPTSQAVMNPPYEPPATPSRDASMPGKAEAASTVARQSAASWLPQSAKMRDVNASP